MSLKIEAIQDKLYKLEQNTKFIEDILLDSDKKITADVGRYNGLEHLLQLSIQIILDTGAHILAEEFGENPGSYQDVISTLGKRKIIDDKFAAEQTEMAKFRNKLIHDYGNIDHTKVLAYAREAPKVFRAFGKMFVDFIKNDKQL